MGNQVNAHLHEARLYRDCYTKSTDGYTKSTDGNLAGSDDAGTRANLIFYPLHTPIEPPHFVIAYRPVHFACPCVLPTSYLARGAQRTRS